MPSVPADKLSTKPVLDPIPASARIPGLLPAIVEPNVNLRNPMFTQAGLAAWLSPFFGSTSPLQYIGDPANRNVSMGPFDGSNTIDPDATYNTFGFACTNNTLGANSNGNLFGICDGNVLGEQCNSNEFGSDCDLNTLADSCNGNRLGYQSDHITFATGCEDNQVRGSDYVSFGANCVRVEVINCHGSSGSPFLIPADSADVVYRNNVLVTSAGATLDPYISAAGPIGTAVIAGTFTNGELQGAQPADSQAGQTFTTTTYDYTYKRGAAGALVWVRLVKG